MYRQVSGKILGIEQFCEETIAVMVISELKLISRLNTIKVFLEQHGPLA